MENTLDSLLNSIVGHPMQMSKSRENKGEARMIIPGMVNYFLNILCNEMPTVRKKQFLRRSELQKQHNIYETPFLMPCYKSITPYPSLKC